VPRVGNRQLTEGNKTFYIGLVLQQSSQTRYCSSCCCCCNSQQRLMSATYVTSAASLGRTISAHSTMLINSQTPRC